MHEPVENAYVHLNFSSANGIFLGGAQTYQHLALPTRPGTYRLRYVMDPMPLADAEYQVEFKIYDLAREELLLWSMKQPRMFSVRGGGVGTSLIRLKGSWAEVEAPANLQRTGS